MNLIIVAGHAIYAGPHPFSDECWFLLPYQKGEPAAYIEHIRRGVELAAADADSILVFSGGASRAEAGARTEALSYWLLADHFGWWGSSEVATRCITEEFARDSFENLLYGICRFREFTAEWPDRLMFVSWAFKRERFGLYCRSIRWPAGRFYFEGPNDPADLPTAIANERKFVIDPWPADPYLASAYAVRKKAERNPWRRTAPYPLSCPGMAPLLAHTGPEIFSGPLPWDSPESCRRDS